MVPLVLPALHRARLLLASVSANCLAAAACAAAEPPFPLAAAAYAAAEPSSPPATTAAPFAVAPFAVAPFATPPLPGGLLSPCSEGSADIRP